MPNRLVITVVQHATGEDSICYRWEARSRSTSVKSMLYHVQAFKDAFPSRLELIKHVVEILEFDGLALFHDDLHERVKYYHNDTTVVDFPQ